MVFDGRLSPPPDGSWFEPSDTENERDYTRFFAVSEYLTELCDVLRPERKKSDIGATDKLVGYDTREGVPCHLTSITAQYAGFESDGRMASGQGGGLVYDVARAILYLPWGFDLATTDFVRLHPTPAHGEVWLAVDAEADTSTLATMLAVRVTSIGKPPEVRP